jgi:hypothetical protein
MYRIEIKPGEENVFRTIEELATAIRNGLVTPRARIFHNASQKWLPIEFHPHYKKALQLPKTNSGESPAVSVKPVEPIRAREPLVVHELVEVDEPPPPRPTEPVKPVEPAKLVEAPRPAPKTREIEIVYTPPIEAKATAPAPVHAPPAAAPKHAAPKSVADKPLPTKPVTIEPVPVAYSSSPVAELPPVDFYESSAVESLIPVASASKARAASSRRRPMVLGSAVAVLVAGAYVVLSGAMPAHQAVADNGSRTEVAQNVSEPAHESTVASSATPDSSMKRRLASAPTPGSGPTFGPRPAPAPKHQTVASIGAMPAPAAPAPKDSVAPIEPAPVDVDVSVPAVPSADSLAPVVTTDSTAIGRILRAVGAKGGSNSR